MSLRLKVALAMAVIVSLATVTFAAASYRTTQARLMSEVDRSLVALDLVLEKRRLDDGDFPDRGPLAVFDAQVINRRGNLVQSTFDTPLPITPRDRELVGRQGASFFSTVDTPTGQYRVRTVGFTRGAVQLGRPLGETNRVLESLFRRTLMLVALVAALSIVVGLWISDRITASLRRLTNAAEHVEATGQLNVVIEERGDDEVGRLAGAFDRMLAALSRSKEQQRRLLQDAGHELRTPLTSLRTNLDTLRRYPGLEGEVRDAIVGDLHAETQELTDLVNEIISVATGDVVDEQPEAFDLAELVHQLGEIKRLGLFVDHITGGDRDDLVDEIGELLGFCVQVTDDRIAHLALEARIPPQSVEVGAQAGERGTQLVASILEEAALLFFGSGQGGQHTVERARQPAHLIIAALLDHHIELAGRFDMFRRVGEASQGSGDPVGDPQTDHDGQCRHQRHQHQGAAEQALQYPVGLPERAPQLHRPAGEPNRSHPVLAGGGVDRREEARALTPHQFAVARGDRQRGIECRLNQVAPPIDHLGIEHRERAPIGEITVVESSLFQHQVEGDQ